MWLCFVANKRAAVGTQLLAGSCASASISFCGCSGTGRSCRRGQRATLYLHSASDPQFNTFSPLQDWLELSVFTDRLGFIFCIVLFPGAGWISSSLVWRRWEVSPCAPARVCCRGRVWSNWLSSTRNIPQHTGSTLWWVRGEDWKGGDKGL